MKTIFFFIGITLVTTGCNTMYKAGQTPDEVYYSPNRSGNTYTSQNQDNYAYNDNSYADDQYLRMKARNRMLWSSIDDFNYWNNNNYSNWGGWSTGAGWIYGNPYYSPYYNNGWNDPWCYRPPVIIVTKYPVRTARTTNAAVLRGYRNNNYNNSNTESYKDYKSSSTNNNTYSNGNTKYNTPSNSSNSSVNRTYNPSSSSSTPVSRPTRKTN